MANETDTGLVGRTTTAEALFALAARPFDPAALLTALPAAEALPYAVGPTPEMLPTFDPAALLGDAARRGPAMIGDGRPLVARIGGVEVVTIPLEHYAALLSPLALARPGVEGEGRPDEDGMLLLLLSLHAEGIVSIDQLVQATSLDRVDLDGRIAAYDGEPAPEAAAVDLGMPQEATIAIPPGPLDTRTTPPEPERRTRYGFRRREKHEKRGGPMDEKGQPDERETDIHDTMPGSTRHSTGLP